MLTKSFNFTRIASRGLCTSYSPSLCSYPPLPPRQTKRAVLREDICWYPGHMHKGLLVMNRRMTTVDCVIEIHDARLPYSGRADVVSQFGQLRPHLLVLNKMDLAEDCDQSAVTNQIMTSAENPTPLKVYFTKLNSPEKQRDLLHGIINKVVEIFKTSDVYNKDVGILLMIAGSPNVGKSTFINAIRCLGNEQPGNESKRRKAARVGKLAGMTRCVGEKIKVFNSPPIYVYDTPGVFEVSSALKNDSNGLETILRLGATGCLNIDALNPEIFADYLLYYMNLRQQFQYVKFLELDQPTDNIVTLLSLICRDNKLILKSDRFAGKEQNYRPDILRASRLFLKWFNEGKFGRLTFKEPSNPKTFPFFLAKSLSV